MGRFLSSNRNIRIAIAVVFVVWVMCLGVLFAAGLIITRNSRARGVSPIAGNPVTEANIQLSPAEGYSGTQVTVSGKNWQPGEVIFVRLQTATGGNDENFAYAGAVADDSGQFVTTFTYPYDSRWLEGDAVQVVARAEASGVQAVAPFRLAKPTVAPTPTQLMTATPTDTPVPLEELTPPAPGMPTYTPRPRPTLPPPPPMPVITDWMGVYYANPDLQGQPVLIRNDGQIAFEWGMNSPAPVVAPDNFSVKWTRNMDFDAGNYRFFVTADDGARLWIDQQVVIDQWHDSGPQTYAAEIYLTQGVHNIRVDYYERIGWSVIKLWWEKIQTNYPDWKGEYFNNPDVEGSPVAVRNDPWPDFSWGVGSPAPNISPENFSARWTRHLFFNAGNYRFSIRVDDGARLWIDGQLVIDQWHDSGLVTYVTDRYLQAGDHAIRFEYYDRVGNAEAHLWWEKIQANYPDWKAEYFNNRKLEGSPVVVRNDPKIDFNWGNDAPVDGVPADGFSVRWARPMRFDSTADYRFWAKVDDGVRLYVDDDLVIDEWRDGGLRTVSGTKRLSKGEHDLRVEYYDRSGSARITVGWEKISATATATAQPGESVTVIPAVTRTPTPIATTPPKPGATAAPTNVPVEPTQAPTVTEAPTKPTAVAEPKITLMPAEGPIGTQIVVKGAGWPAGQKITLTFAQGQAGATSVQINPKLAVANTEVTSSGEFKVVIALPADQGWETQPQVLVVAYNQDLSKTAVAAFTIQQAPTEVAPTATAIPSAVPTEEATQPAITETPSATPTKEVAPTDTPTQEATLVPPTATQSAPETKPTATNTVTSETPAVPEEPSVAPIISLSPVSGTVGITLTISGMNWPAGDTVSFSLTKPKPEPMTVPLTGTVQVNEKGKFVQQIWLPAGQGWELVPEVWVVAETADKQVKVAVPYTIVVETPPTEQAKPEQ